MNQNSPLVENKYKLNFDKWNYLTAIKTTGFAVCSIIITSNFSQNVKEGEIDCGLMKPVIITMGIAACFLGVFNGTCCSLKSIAEVGVTSEDNPYKTYYKIKTGISLASTVATLTMGLISTIWAFTIACNENS
jgi:hypothetical protein